MKKSIIVLLVLAFVISANAQMTGGGNQKQKPEKVAKQKREGKIGLYGIIGYRSPSGSLKNDFYASNGIGIDLGKQIKFNLSDNMAKEISIGIDLTVSGRYLPLIYGSIKSFTYRYDNGNYTNLSLSLDEGQFYSFGPQIGPYISYHIPKTEIHIDLIYKIGFHYLKYAARYYNDDWDSAESDINSIALQSSINFNLRFNFIFINIGYEFDNLNLYTSTDLYGFKNGTYNSIVDNLNYDINASMIKLGLGFML